MHHLLEIPPGARGSLAAYVFSAWLIAVIPSLLYFFTLVYIGANSLRPPVQTLDVTYAGYSILVAPILETALMFPIASLLTLTIPRQRRVQIVLLAAICALAHKIGGGWQQVAASAWPFLVYSVTLITWMTRSNRAAFALTAAVHALYNATFFGVGAVGFFLTAPA